MADTPTSSILKRRLKQLWVHGFIWGIAIVLVALLIWFLLGGGSSTSVPQQAKKASPVKAAPAPSLPTSTAVAPPLPSPAAASLKEQLSQVLAGIKQANQQKDLAKLLSYYSPNFPRLTNRAQNISKSWKTYNYPKMDFDIKDVKSLNKDTALARVTWKVKAQYLGTQKYKNISKTYLIKFVKESGRWRIEAMQNAS
jgi:ketosteroid isomerase-like protein